MSEISSSRARTLWHRWRASLSGASPLWAALSALLVLRLIMMWVFPLFDTTEARYAEMARKMVETGNWLTPQFDYGVPFWGKPPLHTWLSASGLSLFGETAFAARVPILLVSLTVLAALYFWAARVLSHEVARLSVVLLASMGLFYGAAAFVMTDMPLVLGTTLVMIGMWHGINAPHVRRTHALLVGLGLAIGMLAKGPVAVVLCAIPIFGWTHLYRRTDVLRARAWLWGGALFAVLTLPWYIAAEIATPGFLRYFLIGEHIERFLVPGWDGDLYGNGHVEPKGTIWLFWLVSALPWSVGFLVLAFRPRQTVSAFRQDWAGLRFYLLLWVLSPLVLFTPAANILHAYVLPGLPATAVLLVVLLRDMRGAALGGLWGKVGMGCGLAVTGVIFAVIAAIPVLAPDSARLRTHEPPIRAARMLAPGVPLFTAPGRSYSAEFYSAGRARPISWEGIGDLAAPAIVIAPSNRSTHPALARLIPIAQAGRYTVYRLAAAEGEL